MNTLRMEDIFHKIEQAAEKSSLLPRDANVLRLLGEEMFSMTKNLTDSTDCTFSIWNSEKQFELRLFAKAKLSPEDKKGFVSVSSKKENALAKGLFGRIRSAIEDCLYFDGNGGYLTFSPETMEGYSRIWTLNEYMLCTPQDKLKEDWDGLERSILINMADDIIVGAGKGTVQMTVKKSF